MKTGDKLRRFWQSYRGPLLWAAVLFVQSSIPDFDSPVHVTEWDDKWAHTLIYMPLGFLLMRSLAHTRANLGTVRLTLLAIGIGALYGVTDEIHQYFVPGRHMDWRDAAADSLGVVLGSLLYLKLRRQPALKPAHASQE
jgi:VanZ family protein